MSMIKCSECGKEISDKAKVCVHCGNPLENTEQDNSSNENKLKTKKNKKINQILYIILIILINLILFAAGTFHFLNTELVNAEVIYPVEQSTINRFTKINEYKCNIVYEYKGIEYHDTLTFNDDNLPKEIKNSSKDPNFFDVKLKGYIYKDDADNFILDMEYYTASKYIFYVQVILMIPSVLLIIKCIITLVKDRTNSKKGINKVVLIPIILLIAIIVAGVIFYISKNKNFLNNKDDTPVDWGLTINGTSIVLPCTLDELTNVGVNVNEDFYEELMSTTNQTYSDSYVTSDGWAQGIYLNLRTGSDLSKKEKNVIVTSIRYYLPAHSFNTAIGITPDESSLLTSYQFSIKNNITIGSKSEDVIDAFGTDYEPKSETDLNGLYSLIYYKKGNSTLTIGFENGFVREIIITTTSLNINKKEKNEDKSTTIQEAETNDNSDDIDREELLDGFRFFRERGFYNFTEEEYQELQTYSNAELKAKWDKISKIVEIQSGYDTKYGKQLNEIFKKTINIELNSSENDRYTYTPTNKGEPKARVEYVAITENGIKAIYYSVEMTLTITDKQQNNTYENTMRNYYKTTDINELDEVIKITNYDTQTTQNEIFGTLDNSINTYGSPIETMHMSGLPYIYYHVGEYAIYFLPEDMLEYLDDI